MKLHSVQSVQASTFRHSRLERVNCTKYLWLVDSYVHQHVRLVVQHIFQSDWGHLPIIEPVPVSASPCVASVMAARQLGTVVADNSLQLVIHVCTAAQAQLQRSRQVSRFEFEMLPKGDVGGNLQVHLDQMLTLCCAS